VLLRLHSHARVDGIEPEMYDIHERTVPLAVLYADVRQHRQHGAEHRALEGGNSKQGGPDQGRPDEALHARIKAKRRPLP